MEIIMSIKETKYAEIISRVVAREIKQSQAAEILEMSIRQIKRLCKRYKENGLQGLIHKNRGRPGNKSISPLLKDKILELIQLNYSDFGPKLIHEQLKARHQIGISAEWIRLQLIKKGLWKVKRNKKIKIYQKRARRECRGELVQIDGSYHDWFEGRSPKCCLLVAIDDATSEILELRFEIHETVEGYMNLMKSYINKHGCPLAIYSDRLNVFSEGSQFRRALKELNIGLINANSPQAKGRVERANQTLQDRLIKLMRLEKIDNMKEANKYLERYREEHNKNFARNPKSTQESHKKLKNGLILEEIFSIKESRKVSKDLSVVYKKKTYILKSNLKNRLRGKTAKIYEINGIIQIEIEGLKYDYETYEEQSYQEVMNRKELDAWIDKKKRLTVIERMRKNRRGY